MTTTLEPSRAGAALSSLVAVASLALAGWVVADSGGHPLAFSLLIATVVVSAPFVAQLLWPAAFTWRLDAHGLEARSFLRRVAVAWSDVRLARVVSVAGDPGLRLQLGEDGLRASLTLRLPVGADVAALHAALAHHLGSTAGAADTPVRSDPPGSGEKVLGQ